MLSLLLIRYFISIRRSNYLSVGDNCGLIRGKNDYFYLINSNSNDTSNSFDKTRQQQYVEDTLDFDVESRPLINESPPVIPVEQPSASSRWPNPNPGKPTCD